MEGGPSVICLTQMEEATSLLPLRLRISSLYVC